MALGVILHATRTAFLAHAGPWLRRHEQRCSLLLGVVEPSSPQTPLPILASVVDDEQIVAVAVAVAGRKLLTSHGPPAAMEALCHRLRERDIEIPGVIGPVDAARGFALAWDEQATVAWSMRLHRLHEVTASTDTAHGRIRLAAPDDLPLLSNWAEDFVQLTGSDDPRTGMQVVEPLVRQRRLHVWDDDGPVSMAGWSRETANSASITIVYTPQHARGRGYASAVVADLSRTLLRTKRSCLLYTNLAHPAVAAIYARIGYRPLEDHTVWVFNPR